VQDAWMEGVAEHCLKGGRAGGRYYDICTGDMIGGMMMLGI
jgi:hypothetical protein